MLESVNVSRVSEPRPSFGKTDKVMWLKLPFHPVWFRELNKLLGNFVRDESISSLYGSLFNAPMPRVRVAWSNAVPTLSIKLSRC